MSSNKTGNGLSLLGGALLGAAVMYVLDPESGRKRREHLGELAEDAIGTAGGALGSAWESTRGASASLADKAHDLASSLSAAAADRTSDFGSAAGSHARSLGDRLRDFAGDLSGWTSRLGHGVSDRVSDQTSALSDQVDDWADHFRGLSHGARHKLAKTLDPDHVRGPGHAAGWTAAGFGTLMLGAGLMYILDPERGRGRRAWLTNKASQILGDTGTTFRRTGRDLMNKAMEVAGQSQSSGASSGEDTDGERLLQTIRAEAGNLLTRPTDVQFMTDSSGAVTVYGRVSHGEEDKLLKAIHALPGVREIINRLESAAEGSSSGQAVSQL